MSTSAKNQHPKARTSTTRPARLSHAVTRIAVGVDGYPEGQDAAALGRAISDATGAELLLVTVQPEPLVVLPAAMDWKSVREWARHGLATTRDQLAPAARIVVETDYSVARALRRVASREHRDLVIVGSSRHASDGRARIGKRTRQLLDQLHCALAVAPRGLHTRPELRFGRVGVGFDGSPESEAALAFAESVAASADAQLEVLVVVDNRMPALGWGFVWIGAMIEEWESVVGDHLRSLRDRAAAKADEPGVTVTVKSVAGRPADALLSMSSEVDLLVIGSRRWGPVARVLLGSTGEALLHDAACPVVAVPRPA